MNEKIVMVSNGYDLIDGRNAYQSDIKSLTLGDPMLDENKKMQYKMESEKEALQDKLTRQTKAILQLDQLKIDNKDLQKDLSNALIENQLLKDKFLPQQPKIAPK